MTEPRRTAKEAIRGNGASVCRSTMMESELDKSSIIPGALDARRRAKAEEITRKARATIASEKQARDEKTVRLRELRQAKAAVKRSD